MTDNEIIQALEKVLDKEQTILLSFFGEGGRVKVITAQDILDLINRRGAENEDLFYKLTGVMHYVDKWLDGDELKQDEVNRATTMREKTLQITETQEQKIETLRVRYKKLLQKYRATSFRTIEQHNKFVRLRMNDCIEARNEAMEEFAEKLLETFSTYPDDMEAEAIYIRNQIKATLNELTHKPTKIEHNSLCETETYESR